MTPIALHSVAHTMSQQIPAVLEMSQECRATPHQKTVSQLFSHPLSQLCSEEQTGEVSHWKCQRCRGKISLGKRIALHGGVAATLTPIALHCATKELCADLFIDFACAKLANISVTTTTNIFPKALRYKMGGVLQYKWEAHCDTNGRSTDNNSPFRRA